MPVCVTIFFLQHSKQHMTLYPLDDAEGDAHQFLPAAALLLTSGRSDDPN